MLISRVVQSLMQCEIFSEDVIEYTKRVNMSDLLITIDFEKAFDSLSHKYLLKALQAYIFGSNFFQWIRTSDSNIGWLRCKQWFWFRLTALTSSTGGFDRGTPSHQYYSL